MSQNLDFQALAKIPFAAATSLTGALTKQVAAFVTEAQGYSLAAFQSNLALIQKLASVKNVDELVNVQTEHARTSYEASIAWSKKVGELAADLSSQAVKTVLISPQSASVSVKVPSVGKRLQATE